MLIRVLCKVGSHTNFDFRWLTEQARDAVSQVWLTRIQEWRRRVFENNEFIKGNTLFSLRLGSYELWFRPRSAFSAIEVFVEIFKNNGHSLAPGFLGSNAQLVVDIGANQGFYALKIKEQNPQCKVFCIEPNPYVCEILEKNIQTNRINDIILVNQAVGATDERVTLDVIREVDAISARNIKSVPRSWLKDELIEKIQVDGITLDTLCQQYNITHIDILKIDVEGSEIDILTNSAHLLERVDKIVVERHSREIRDAVVAFLTTNHFKLIFEEDPDCSRYYGDLYFSKC